MDTQDAIINVANFSDSRLYLVKSQSQAGLPYYVQASGDSQAECTCPDHQRGNTCKHSLAVMIHEERLADQARYDAWLAEQYEREQAASDYSCFSYDPTVDFPID